MILLIYLLNYLIVIFDKFIDSLTEIYHNYPEEYNKIIISPVSELTSLRLSYSDTTIDNIDNVNFILFLLKVLIFV